MDKCKVCGDKTLPGKVYCKDHIQGKGINGSTKSYSIDIKDRQ